MLKRDLPSLHDSDSFVPQRKRQLQKHVRARERVGIEEEDESLLELNEKSVMATSRTEIGAKEIKANLIDSIILR